MGVRTLNVTAASATPPLSHCHAWPLCPCHAWLGANNTVQRVNSWTVGGTQAGRGQAITEEGRTVGRREQGNKSRDGGREGGREGGGRKGAGGWWGRARARGGRKR